MIILVNAIARPGAVPLAIAGLVLALVAAPARLAAGPQQTGDTAAQKQRMIELGLQHETAWDLYQALQAEANGGTRLSWTDLPDWTGLWTKAPGEGFTFDPEDELGEIPSAKLTPAAHERMMERIERLQQGIEYDPISDCSPPGFPRWLGIPFLREHIVTPDQTWMSSETVNNMRRIYTDGRAHIPEADRYPLPYGDSIGFWDDEHRLVIHTNQLKAGIYTRAHPDYSDQVETVEIWEKVGDNRIEARVWVYDPPNLAEPWYVKHSYTKVPNEDKSLRIRYWDCHENQNNEVIQTQDGNSTFADFTFTEADDN